MTASDIYALLNLILSCLCLLGVAVVGYQRRATILHKHYLRWVYPIAAIIFLFFGVAYGLVVFVPSERDAIGRSILRPAVPVMLLSFFAVVWLVTREAERLHHARLALENSEAARQLEQKEFLEFREGLIKEREDFVAIALHEINTPLTLLNGYVGMMVAAEDLHEAQEMAAAIQRTTGRFAAMKKLFDARLHSLYLEAFDLCQCAAAAISDPLLYVATRKVPGQVDLQFSCNGPITVEADKEKLNVAIWELIRNGLKAVEEEAGRILVEVTAENGHAVVIVEDNGVGIPEHYQPRIFEAGSQFFADMTTRRNEGTGHGLYTVLHIMNEHHGAVSLDWSEEGKGSRFVLYLPRR